VAADPISATAVDLVFDQPSATDAHLVFGATYVAPRDDIRLSATLPLPTGMQPAQVLALPGLSGGSIAGNALAFEPFGGLIVKLA